MEEWFGKRWWRRYPTHLPNPSLFHCFAENPSRVTQYRDDLVSRLLRERRRMGPDDDGAFWLQSMPWTLIKLFAESDGITDLCICIMHGGPSGVSNVNPKRFIFEIPFGSVFFPLRYKLEETNVSNKSWYLAFLSIPEIRCRETFMELSIQNFHQLKFPSKTGFIQFLPLSESRSRSFWQGKGFVFLPVVARCRKLSHVPSNGHPPPIRLELWGTKVFETKQRSWRQRHPDQQDRYPVDGYWEKNCVDQKFILWSFVFQ